MHTKHFIIKINSKCDHGLIGFCNVWFATNATSKVTITFQQTLSTIAIYGLNQHTLDKVTITFQGIFNKYGQGHQSHNSKFTIELLQDFQIRFLSRNHTTASSQRTPAGFTTILIKVTSHTTASSQKTPAGFTNKISSTNLNQIKLKSKTQHQDLQSQNASQTRSI